MHRLIALLIVPLLFLASCDNKDKEKNRIIKPEKKEDRSVYKLQEKISSAINSVKPSVVTVLSKASTGKTPIIFRFSDEVPPIENESLGSGFVIRADQDSLYVVTNSHVVEKAKVITVKLSNGEMEKAKVVGKDEKSDIALLKIPKTEKTAYARPVKIGDPKKLKVGYLVISGGSPYNIGLTFTLGIVSALDRNLGISAYERYIQTDAAINPGDSGGPLINIDGEVVGMNTAIIQAGQGLGFAIPIDTVIEIADQLYAYGRVKRGWLGVLVQELSPKVKKKLGISYGVQVIKVFRNSPAYKSGIKAGDIILKIKGKEILSPSDLKYMASRLKPGEIVEVEFIRGKEVKKVQIKVGELVDRK
ncbi:MAG: trypsin-like serine protease [Aquificae bacterium]|nr:trypsin-like serine protease [Aquificota bacterium]